MQTTLSTNTSTAWQSDHAGTVFLQAVGTFGGGTLTVEVQLEDGSTTQAVQDGSFTSGPVSKIIEIPRHMPVQRGNICAPGPIQFASQNPLNQFIDGENSFPCPAVDNQQVEAFEPVMNRPL